MIGKLLIIEGETQEGVDRHLESGGTAPSQLITSCLQEICPELGFETYSPCHGPADMPTPSELESYAGILLGGSSLHVYDNNDQVMRQIVLARRIFAASVPFFGICWGLQVATVAAGGMVEPHPSGREIGFARAIRATDQGQTHMIFANKEPVFNAITVHKDQVTVLADGMTVLASNRWSEVQCASILHRKCQFWGVQYHPEHDLKELAAVIRRFLPDLVSQGIVRSMQDAETYVSDILALHADPSDSSLAWRLGVGPNVLDPKQRTMELRNWIDLQVLPRARA